jgi:ABC-2 type transport system permease protein
MRKALVLAGREYLASVRTKGFIIGLIIAPLMMGGSLIVFLLFKDRVDTADKRVVIVDRASGIAPWVIGAADRRNAMETIDSVSGQKVKPRYHFTEALPTADRPQQVLDLSERVQRGDIDAFVVIGSHVLHPEGKEEEGRIAYYARNPAVDELRRWLFGPINDRIKQLRLQEAGIEPASMPDLFWNAAVEPFGLVMRDESGKIAKERRSGEAEALLAPIVTMLLMLMMIMMSVPGLLNSVMEEKTQRIAEVLLSSMTPFEMMTGKLIGGVAVSLTSAAIYLIGAVVVLQSLALAGHLPLQALLWFPTYMLLAVIMYGSLALALGASCSEPKDAQSLTFPVILPIMLPMFFYILVAREPGGTFATWMSLVPFFTPLLMTLRLATPETVPMWQPIVGLVGLALLTYAFVFLGARIFRVGILIQGTPPKFSRIVEWMIRG